MIRALPNSQRLTRNRRSALYRPGLDALEKRVLLAADLNFDPLTASAAIGSTNGAIEAAPFSIPDDYSQTRVQTQVRDPDYPDNAGQNTLNENGFDPGRYLFTAGYSLVPDPLDPLLFTNVGVLSRTDLISGQTVNLLSFATAAGQLDGETLADHLSLQSLSALEWTPWGTLLVAEDIDANDPAFIPDPDAPAENGLVYEVVDPTGPNPVIFARPALGSMKHAGLAIDANSNVYLADDFGLSSSILMFTPDFDNAIDSPLEVGTLSVLNIPGNDVGAGEWVALGLDVEISVRIELGLVTFTPYASIADLEIGIANVNNPDETSEVLYVSQPGDDLGGARILGIDLDGDGNVPNSPEVRVYVDDATEDAGVGGPVGIEFAFPTDLTVDAAGRLYIAEKQATVPDDSGNDVWVAVDLDDDGVADSLGRLASLATRGAAPQGIYVNPFNNLDMFVSVSNPTSRNDSLFVIHKGATDPIISEVDIGGEVVLVIVGSDGGDRITITGDNILSVKIGATTTKGLAPSSTILIYGNAGNDSIVLSTRTPFDVVAFLGDGNDYITTGLGADSVSGGNGNDRIMLSHGANFAAGNAGNDSLQGGADTDTFLGGDGNDYALGQGGDDWLYGDAGNDRLIGAFGNDFIRGGANNDHLEGGYGFDILIGDAGSDRLSGGPDDDVLLGGNDSDQLFGNHGADLLIGDRTPADGDEALLAVLWETWASGGQTAADVTTALGGNPIADNSRADLLDGAFDIDLFFRYAGQDRVVIRNDGDVIEEL